MGEADLIGADPFNPDTASTDPFGPDGAVTNTKGNIDDRLAATEASDGASARGLTNPLEEPTEFSDESHRVILNNVGESVFHFSEVEAAGDQGEDGNQTRDG